MTYFLLKQSHLKITNAFFALRNVKVMVAKEVAEVVGNKTLNAESKTV